MGNVIIIRMDEMTTSFPIINNRYQIFSTIATGGMAVVYSAQDLMLERKVALKILKKELSGDQAFQNKFRAEARASAKLIHPNIITTFDFGFDGDRLYIVMEFIDGTDLKSKIKDNPNGLDLQQALKFIRQAASGLAYAHKSGYVHCDIKPQNMLVSRNDVLKITDFGIARALDTISRDERYDVVWGSPFYFSPEQASGLAPSPATDIYSFGVIAFELLTGKLPFNSDDAAQLAEMHRTKPAPSMRSLRAEIPEKLDNLVQKCLSKQTQDRFPTGSELVTELNAIEHGLKPLPAKPPAQPEKPVRPRSAPASPPRKGLLDKLPRNPKLITIILSIIALIMVGGLIPFYLFIIFTINR
jgi:serine/threonine-protein kinase